MNFIKNICEMRKLFAYLLYKQVIINLLTSSGCLLLTDAYNEYEVGAIKNEI